MDYDDYLDVQLFGDENENMDELDQENDGIPLSTEAKEGGEDETLKNVWESSKDVAEKKTPRVTKPRPKFTEREMISEKGLPALVALFDNYKPSDKLTPYENINQILNKMEYWAHCLFPQLQFEDFLEKAEHIGRKRLVQASMQKLRYGMPLDEAMNVMADDAKAADGVELAAAKTAEELFDDQFVDDFYDYDAFSAEAFNVVPKKADASAKQAVSQAAAMDSEPEMDDDEFEEQLRNIFGKRDISEKKHAGEVRDDNTNRKASPLPPPQPSVDDDQAEQSWDDQPIGDFSPPHDDDPPTASAKRRKIILDSDSYGEEAPAPGRRQVDSDGEDGPSVNDRDDQLTAVDGNTDNEPTTTRAQRKSRLTIWSDDEEN